MVTEKRRRWWSRLGLWLGGVAAVLLVAYLALIVVLRAVVDPTTLAARAEPHLSAALNRRVEIAAADLSIFPRPEVHLMRLRVENLPDFEGLPLATVDEFRLRPRLLPLIRRRVEIDRVQVLGPRVLLQVAEDGTSNFGDFVPASREAGEAEAADLSFEVRGIDIRDGRVGYRDAVTGRTVQVDGLRASGSVGRTGDGLLTIDLRGESDSTRFALPPGWDRGLRGLAIGGSLRARVGPAGAWLDIESGSIAVNGLELEVRGRVDSLTSTVRQLDLSLAGENVDLSEMVRTLPDSVRVRLPVSTWGTLHADLTVRGPMGPGVAPTVDGLVMVRDAGARRGDGPPVLEEASADIRLAGGEAQMSGVRASLPGGDLEASGTVALDSMLAYRIEVDAVASAQAMVEALGLSDPERASPRSGSLRLDATLSGAGASMDGAAVTGALVVRDLEVVGGSLRAPVEVADGRVDLLGREARWNGVAILVEGNEISTSGQATDLWSGTPTVDATARSPRLDVDAILGEGHTEVGYGRIAWGRLGERPVLGRPAEEWAVERDLSRPGPLPVRGVVAFEVDSLIRLPYRLSDVRGRLILEPGNLRVAETSFQAYGGTGTAGGVLGLGAEESEPFHLDLELRDVRAEEYLAQNTPLGRLITGTMSLDLSLEGGLDTLFLPLASVLQGVGRFEIRDGGLAPNPLTDGILSLLGAGSGRGVEFSRWTSPLVVREGVLLLDGSTFTGTPLAADLTGALGFGGSVDLGALVRPDSALSAAATAGDVVRRYVQAGGLLEIALRLTGNASDPSVELDPEAMEQSGRSILEEAAEDAVQAGEDDLRERGLDLLRGLAGQDESEDTVPAAEADTAGADGGG